MKLYSRVIVGDDVVKRLEERGELLPFLKKRLVCKIAGALEDRLVVYRREYKEDYDDIPSGTTQYECIVDIDIIGGNKIHGVDFDLIPLEKEEGGTDGKEET